MTVSLLISASRGAIFSGSRGKARTVRFRRREKSIANSNPGPLTWAVTQIRFRCRELRLPALWGTRGHLELLFGSNVTIAAERRNSNFRYKSPAHRAEVFRTDYGPVLKAFAALDGETRIALERDLSALDRRIQHRYGRHHGRPQRVSRARRHAALRTKSGPGGLGFTGHLRAKCNCQRSPFLPPVAVPKGGCKRRPTEGL